MFSAGLRKRRHFIAWQWTSMSRFEMSQTKAERGSNLAETLRKLGRFDEARQEIFRAIKCDAQFGHASEPWKTWSVLETIRDERWKRHRRSGGKAQGHRILPSLPARRRREPTSTGRICLEVTQSLLAGDPAAAASLLQELASDPQLPALLRPFIQALQAIVAGSRDRTLADTPELNYRMAAEILFLLKRWKSPDSAGG